jgi:oxazoline/thiazoline synthase
MDESLESSRHPVVRRPQCPACGDPGALPGPRVELGPAPKRHVASGAVRAVTPEETLERLEKHVSPITGAISWLADSTQPEDRGAAYTYRAGHRFPILGKERGLVVLRQNMRGRSGGKGRTEAQAKVSALCEGLERYCGIWFGEEPAVRATWEERGERALDIHDLMLWSDRQYAERDAWNRSQNSELHLVPVRLERDRPVDWSTVWSLTREEPRELPTAYCFYGHPDIADPDTFFCAGDSNGQGAGNTLEEAVMQGLMELVERDSVALWWYSRARVPALDLDSLGDRYYDDLREEYARMGREVWALDITSDLGIPVAVAVSRRVDGEREDLIFGFGAHADPRLAVMRAVSEMNQFLPGIRRNPRTGVPLLDDPPALEWWESSSLVTDPYLAPKDGVAARRIGELPDLGTDDLRDDVEACRARLEEAGLELFALDQSRPDVELRVVRVMVPGLRHFWRRLAPGRLYDVPPRLGWVDRPPAEEDLNPKSVWF